MTNWTEGYEAAKEWLATQGRRKTVNRDIGHSYGLKHYAERWYDATHSQHEYVSTEAVIAAARDMGFLLEQVDSINYCINISSKTVHDADKSARATIEQRRRVNV